MISNINTVSLNGLEGNLVEVQAGISMGLPTFDIVGLPDMSVRESKERIKEAIKSSGIEFPSRKIVINLAPASTKKEGSSFDLPIAISILASMGKLNFGNLCDININKKKEKNLFDTNINKMEEKNSFDTNVSEMEGKNLFDTNVSEMEGKNLSDTIFIGELSLDGKLNHINGVLPMCLVARDAGIKRIILPRENAREAGVIDELEIIGVNTLGQVIDYINRESSINPVKVDVSEIFNKKHIYLEDFADVKGQENAKRALEIAAAGGHNCLLIGEPGSGKTMLARRVPSILPDLTFEEALEITKIHSISGILDNDIGIVTKRPFRSPHTTISPIAMIGGGKIPIPGEISLAHNGVLFLDEFPEFNKKTLEVLRGPLEDGIVTISRLYSRVKFPSKFMLIASMNPCPCGYYGSIDKKCTCSQAEINRYLNRISGPLLDRIDLHIEVQPVKYQKLDSNEKAESSIDIKKRVDKARKIQHLRYSGTGIFSNSELTPKMIEKYCSLNDGNKKIMKMAFTRLGLSARAYSRILKVARTIADLDGSKNIEDKHLLEAIQFRTLDRKYGDKF